MKIMQKGDKKAASPTERLVDEPHVIHDILKMQDGDLSINSLHHPQQNHLLAALPKTDLAVLLPHLQLVLLPVGKMLFEPSESQRYGSMAHRYFLPEGK